MKQRKFLLKSGVVLFITALFFPFHMAARKDGGFRFSYPLNVPMSLSGNYGELRSNHFHAGIDFRIGGVAGAPVFAAADGYISRISVSPSGYGNALYITHPEGYTTIYGHLHRFADKIREYVIARQYETRNPEIDLTLDSTFFPVKRGDLIAFGGNTGSSGGPHLHFEVRKGERSLNIAKSPLFPIKDEREPVIRGVTFTGYTVKDGVPVLFPINVPAGGSAVIPLPRLSYVAIDAVDKMQGSNAIFAVGEYSVILDGETIYYFAIGEGIPLNESRYLNSLIDYPLKRKNGHRMVKSYIEPGNGLQYKMSSRKGGLIVLDDNAVHSLEIVVRDYSGNCCRMSCKIRRDEAKYAGAVNDTLPPKGSFMAWHLPSIYKKEGFRFSIPAGALYRPIYFNAERDTLSHKGLHSRLWRISGYGTYGLHLPATLSIKYEGPDYLKNKALLVLLSPSGKIRGVGGEIDGNGYVTSKVSQFGSYAVGLDSVPPRVRAGFSNGAALRGDIIGFVIYDTLSGLYSYNVEIDGHWVLSLFDAKSSRLAVDLKTARIKKGARHNLIIRVCDRKGNETVVKRNFKW